MPQIWMTYEELAAMFDCSVTEAQTRIRDAGLDRKISRDGQKRAKLNAVMAAAFFEYLKAVDRITDIAVQGLQTIHGQMRHEDLSRPQPPRLLTSRFGTK